MLQGKNKHVVQTENVSTSAAHRVGGLFNTRSFERMSIFGKKQPKELPPLFSETEIDGATYDQVMDFLVSVNDDDYKKIIKVADTYRKTHCDVAKITGIEQQAQPSIFELQTQPARPVAATAPKATDTEAGNFLDEDDDLTAAFMDDEAPTPPAVPGTGTAKPIKVTDDTDQLQS